MGDTPQRASKISENIQNKRNKTPSGNEIVLSVKKRAEYFLQNQHTLHSEEVKGSVTISSSEIIEPNQRRLKQSAIAKLKCKAGKIAKHRHTSVTRDTNNQSGKTTEQFTPLPTQQNLNMSMEEIEFSTPNASPPRASKEQTLIENKSKREDEEDVLNGSKDQRMDISIKTPQLEPSSQTVQEMQLEDNEMDNPALVGAASIQHMFCQLKEEIKALRNEMNEEKKQKEVRICQEVIKENTEQIIQASTDAVSS